MKTKVYKVNKKYPESKIIEEAANVIKQGGLVAFPTETVYGLGANGFDKDAICKIFKAKGRPADNPLIFHIVNFDQLAEVSLLVTQQVKKLVDVFWPGPLTIIVPKNNKVPIEATAGLNTVAVRMPSNNVAQELIRKSNVPIAAPSANLSGKPSSTSAVHVEFDLLDKIDMILDSGNCDFGIESTVLDMTSSVPVILRPGAVTKKEIEEVIGEVVDAIENFLDEKPKSPGMKYTHYKPNAKLYIVEGSLLDIVNEINKLAKDQKDKKIGILASEQTKNLYNSGEILVAGDRNSSDTIAHNLYDCLRQFDMLEVDIIYSESFEQTAMGTAIMNRLEKASGFKRIEASLKPTINLLFVCTGNTCRSPMAEYLARDLFYREGLQLNIESRGISVFFPSSASENSIKALKKYNISLENHKSRQIKKDDILNATLILTMTSSHKAFLKNLCDDDNIYTLCEYASIDGLVDIDDPFGGSEEEYQNCAEQIKECIEKIAKKIMSEL